MGDGEGKTQPHLMPQDAVNVDASKLTALSPEVVSAGHRRRPGCCVSISV
jgi:hypothetical protein